MRQALIYPGEDGYWVAEMPSLPGCISQGETYDGALVNIKEAIDLWIEGAAMDGEAIPEDKPLSSSKSPYSRRQTASYFGPGMCKGASTRRISA